MVDLKGLLPKKNKKEYFWSIVLEKDWIQAGIWNAEEGKVVMISVSPPAPWADTDELVNAVDTALSSAVSDLPEDAQEPSKTVFAVPSAWVDEGQIKDDYLAKIKKVSTKLDLKPVGFVVLAEAIPHFLKSEEGAPVSAVLVGLGKEQIEVSLVRSGKVVGATDVMRSVSLEEDVAEGLTRVGDENDLPSRIILYDGKEGELEEAKTSLVGAKWEDNENVKFLHSPKVDTIDSKNKVFATALAGGSEMTGATGVAGGAGEDADVAPVSEREIENETDPMSLEETGFVVNKDVVQGQVPEPVASVDEPETEQVPFEQRESAQDKHRKFALTGVVSWAKDMFNSFVNKIAGGGQKGPKRVVYLASIGVIVLFALAFLAWWFLPKAEVVVYISPNQLEERVGIFVDPEVASVDLDSKTLPGNVLTEEIDGTKTMSTTGTKTVGDKATGTVKLYRVGSSVSLSSGTVIEGSGGLEFVLDNDVNVASGSASSPSNTEVSVTAGDIGSEYNLASGESFTVSNYPTSELEAKNDDAFSGGSSREISAVSEDDTEKLLSDLTDELEEKAKEAFKKQVEENLTNQSGCSEGCVFIEDSTVVEVADQDFSAIVGDEADTLRLDLTLVVSGLVVDKKSLIEVANETFKEKVPTGYVLREDQISMRFSFDEEDDGVYAIDVVVSANLLPELKIDEIAKGIAGKSPEAAREFLKNVPGFGRVEILLKPKLPGKLGSLPRLSRNIDLQVAAEK